MSTIINIGLAEDHGALRQGYVSLLKQYKKLNVLFDVEDGKELLEKLKIARPHVLLLDLEMPIMRGQEVLEIIKSKYPSVKVIVVSGYFQRDYIIECFKLGVKAFLRKEHKIEKIVEAIEITYEKGGFVDNEVALILAAEINSSNNSEKLDLTENQIEVLRLICAGHTNKSAAKILKMSVGGIKYHRSNLMERTNSNTLMDLITFAIQNKYIEPK